MSFEESEGVRGKWIYRDGKLVPFEEKKIRRAYHFGGLTIDEFENPVTGEIEDSLPKYERKLKERGYFVKGNDRLKFELPKREERFREIREATLEAERQIKYGMAPSTSEERELWEKQQRESERN